METTDRETIARLQFDLMARIGAALLSIQTTERVLRLVATFVLQRHTPLTAELLLAQTEQERKKTLGYFLAEIRKRADIDVHFDRTLSEYLRRRNILAHHLSDIPGWDTDTLRGLFVGRRFVNELIEMNEVVAKVLAGLVRGWQLQTGVATPPWPDHEFFREVDEKYVPLIESLFTAKET